MEPDRLVNGVFQGGGAKSIAYAGALEALVDRDVWFGSVAGASAGAIASSLIAAGLRLHDLKKLIPQALAAVHTSVPARVGLAVVGRATSVFDGEPLREWLDQTYARAIGHDRAVGPVTFADLHAATGIELYVIAFDLATGRPAVFSRRSSPTVDVAGAVAASSAIPSAFPAGRIVMRHPADGARVHQLVDGGAWANYPSFVFDDRAFRTWLAGESRHDHAWTDADEVIWRAESDRPVVGFVLGEPDPPAPDDPLVFVPADGPTVDHRFDRGPASTASGRAMHLVGATLSSDWARLAVGLALVVWTAIGVATLPVGFRRWSTWLAGWMPDPLYPVVLVGSLAVAVLAVLASIALIAAVMVVGRLLADTLLPAIRSMLGVPLDVPPWIGLDDRSVVVRVPREGLKTTRFDVDQATCDRAIATARAGVSAQLDGSAGDRLEQLLDGAGSVPTSHEPRTEPARTEAWQAEAGQHGSPATIALAALLAVGAGALAWWATTSAASAGIVEIVLLLLAAVAVVALAARTAGDRARRRAHERSLLGIRPDRLPRPRVAPPVVIAIGAALVVAGLLVSVGAMDARADDTVVAEVARATELDGRNRYELRPEGDAASIGSLTVESERHLRLGERTFVRVDADGAELAGALDDVWFAVSIVLVVIGLATITAGARTRRWTRRNERLAAIAGKDTSI